ncbi:unnamed protein product [Cylicocyclus nassatus]|uniref:Uncharacterized protein n=1 Tax=Cylicocyclus nassatus TaxID=53992 RepID=A0AA36DWF0_CYLNA|nr:unnamed protein product [Cylicocyclus nassatus]
MTLFALFFIFVALLTPVSIGNSLDDIDRFTKDPENRRLLFLSAYLRSLQAMHTKPREFVTLAGYLGFLDAPSQPSGRLPLEGQRGMSPAAIFDFNERMYSLASNPTTRNYLASRFAHAMIEALDRDHEKWMQMQSSFDPLDDQWARGVLQQWNAQTGTQLGESWPEQGEFLPASQ